MTTGAGALADRGPARQGAARAHSRSRQRRRTLSRRDARPLPEQADDDRRRSGPFIPPRAPGGGAMRQGAHAGRRTLPDPPQALRAAPIRSSARTPRSAARGHRGDRPNETAPSVQRAARGGARQASPRHALTGALRKLQTSNFETTSGQGSQASQASPRPPTPGQPMTGIPTQPSQPGEGPRHSGLASPTWGQDRSLCPCPSPYPSAVRPSPPGDLEGRTAEG